jgi:hypothetical protein
MNQSGIRVRLSTDLTRYHATLTPGIEDVTVESSIQFRDHAAHVERLLNGSGIVVEVQTED